MPLKLAVSVGRSVGWLVTHSFDDSHIAPYWPTWPCFLMLAFKNAFLDAILCLIAGTVEKDFYHVPSYLQCHKLLTFKVFVLIATICLDSQGSVLVATYYIILLLLYCLSYSR